MNHSASAGAFRADGGVAEISLEDSILASMGVADRVAAAHPGVILIYVSDEVCGTEGCPVIIDDTIDYCDDSHITASFAATLSRPIADAVDAADGWQTVAELN